MTEAAPAKQTNRIQQYAVLGAAVVVAVVVVGFLFLSGSGDSPPSPAQTVRDYYAAYARGDGDAAQGIVVPDLRDDAVRAYAPFAGLPDAPSAADKPAVSDLKVMVSNNTAGWATVRASGNVATKAGTLPFDDLFYLQRVGNTWYVSDERAFTRAFATPGAKSANGLGVLSPERPKEGQPAPDFALLDVRDQRTVRKLSDFKGRPVVVNWYASWCGPCKQEIPDFQDAQKALGDSVVFLGVDYQESADRAAGILDVFQAKYLAVLDSDGAVGEHYRVSGMPTTFFVDKDGILRVAKTGRVTTADLEANLAKVGLTYKAPPRP